jgi:hypothetical protein
MEEIAISNSFVEKSVFEAHNTTFIKFDYLKTPQFVDEEKDYTTKVLIALLGDGSMGIYSLNSGNLLTRFDVNQVLNETNQDTEKEFVPVNWSGGIQSLLTDSYDDTMTVTISDFDGNVHILDFELQLVS